jgi:hypothetical protein
MDNSLDVQPDHKPENHRFNTPEQHLDNGKLCRVTNAFWSSDLLNGIGNITASFALEFGDTKIELSAKAGVNLDEGKITLSFSGYNTLPSSDLKNISNAALYSALIYALAAGNQEIMDRAAEEHPKPYFLSNVDTVQVIGMSLKEDGTTISAYRTNKNSDPMTITFILRRGNYNSFDEFSIDQIAFEIEDSLYQYIACFKYRREFAMQNLDRGEKAEDELSHRDEDSNSPQLPQSS